ncbi:MAG: SRPBCC family protein [Saprospirales bacterium]|jgi:effector-binding domain-containing protein|nr:SRPBCC family protein [Saprospirales bacterium]MBK8921730.1 SRPBCC family protein [Saprospirales bacterium]
MKILKILLYAVLGIVALMVVLGLFATKDYHIERNIEIDAPRELVFNQLRYFKNFERWSPWAALDPDMKTSITGTDGEPGAVYKWSGNDDVGKGQQTLLALNPDRLDIEVKFTEPFESTSPSYLTLKENGNKTTVTWGFDMHIAFPWNGFAMFTDVDASVGKDYAKGLENLKKVCEAIAHKKYRGYEVTVQDLPVTYYVGIRKTVAFPEIPAFFAANLGKTLEQVQKSGATVAGVPSGLFWSYDEKKGVSDMAAAIPVAANQKFEGGLSIFPVGGSKALHIEYLGAYEKSGEAHYAMDDYMAEKGLQSIPPVIEEYVIGPGQEPDTSKWRTKIIYFVELKPEQEVAPEQQ